LLLALSIYLRLKLQGFQAVILIAKADCDVAMYRRFIAIAAWLSLAFIVFLTLSPVGLRPQVAGVGLEHLAAFAVMGLLFAVAYPRHLVPIVALVLGSAAILELLQLITPDRHARFSDMLFKLAGGSIGIAVARFWDRSFN
jgi:hypothetical protein